ncbi:hypothetical protein [Nostoc sp. C117]
MGNITPSKAQVSPPGFFGLSAIAHWPRHAIATYPLRKWGSDRTTPPTYS